MPRCMDQMEAGPDRAPAVKTMRFEHLESGFFRLVGKTGIFYGMPRGRWTFPFPVRANGNICNHSDTTLSPTQEIEVVDPATLGITELKWT